MRGACPRFFQKLAVAPNALIAARWNAGRILLPSSFRHSVCCTIKTVTSCCRG